MPHPSGRNWAFLLVLNISSSGKYPWRNDGRSASTPAANSSGSTRQSPLSLSAFPSCDRETATKLGTKKSGFFLFLCPVRMLLLDTSPIISLEDDCNGASCSTGVDSTFGRGSSKIELA
eukprot:Lithocolla_globosa_v1_NODE_789_length_3277_cov_8.782433.p4 type:complete len:119 gc:universal NODE_789_length_3277_cov_8.782433:1282-1638(+)